jgi:membrane-associated HD superfamily phosphohydrolase/Skp family chaperone for outer membrane proteins
VVAAFTATVVLCLAVSPRARGVIPEYQTGQTSRLYVVTPFPINVVDPDKSAELKVKEAQRVAPVFRWNTNAASEAVAEMRATFETNRARFIAAVRAHYQKPAIDERAANTQSFRAFVVSFRASNADIPLPLPLARLWARNLDDAPFLAPREEVVAATAALWIRPEQISDEARAGGQPRLIPTDLNGTITAAQVEKPGFNIRRTNTLALSRARAEMAKELAGEDKALARMLASFIKPNCLPEDAVTRELRARRVKDVWSIARFDAGQTIVHPGEVVTPLAKAALDDLRIRSLAVQAQVPVKQDSLDAYLPWLVGGISALVMLLILWRLTRRPAVSTALAVTSQGAATNLPDPLARVLGDAVVQKLYGDRKQLLAAQNTAVAEAQRIEERIESIQSGVQEKFRAYEKRITQLERELAEAEEQNRDLIRAKITLAKQELETERARNRAEWN